jgi:hypothetical protein
MDIQLVVQLFIIYRTRKVIEEILMLHTLKTCFAIKKSQEIVNHSHWQKNCMSRSLAKRLISLQAPQVPRRQSVVVCKTLCAKLAPISIFVKVNGVNTIKE